MIPFLGLILGFGMLVIALALINILPDFIVIAYSSIIESLNTFIAWVAQFEGFLFRDIPFTILQVICSYFIIMALVQVYKFRNFKWITLSLIAIICLQSVFFYDLQKTQGDAFIIFNKSRYTMIGQKHNEQLIMSYNLDSLRQKTDNVIRNYKVGESIKEVITDSLQSFYQFNDKNILVIDSLAIYKGLSFRPNYVLLRNSPRLNLNRVIDSINPELIIADASNYKSYVKRWKATCEHKKIPFHQTSEKGALIIK